MYGLNENSGPGYILVKTALDNLVDDSQLAVAREGLATATDPVIFSQDGSSAMGKAFVVSSVIGGGGYFQKSTDDLAPAKEIAKRAASPKTTAIADFKIDLDIPRTFMADQQQQAVAKAVRQETQAWVSTRDRNAFAVYANGFVTTYPNSVTIDGVALFSNSHTNQNGDTVDNLETGVLNTDNLNTLVVSLRNQVNQTGVKVGYQPDFLLTSNAGHMSAMATTKSVLRAGTGNNDLNYFSELYPGMKVSFSQFLDDTSTTAYFIGAKNHNVIRYEREAFFTDLVDWKTQRNDCYIYKMRAREEVDALEYSGVAGSTGTV